MGCDQDGYEAGTGMVRGGKMKIYVVTSGEYSDYHIEAVFTNYHLATQYANLDSDREIEEYEADSIQINDPELFYCIEYDFEKDKIVSLGPGRARDTEIYEYQPIMRFSVRMNDRLFDDIREHGCQSELLLKISRDKLAQELEKLQLSKNALIDRIYRSRNHYFNRYSLATTSLDTQTNPFEKVATQEVTDQINAMYENGEQLPDAFTLMKMIRESRQKMEGK